MSVLLGAPASATPAPARPASVADPRHLWLEGPSGTWLESAQAFIMAGFKGHGLPPSEVITETSPGMDGAWLREVRVGPREVFLPVFISSPDPVSQINALAAFRRLVQPYGDQGLDGTLKLVGSSHLGVRELSCVYLDGMEGEEGTQGNLYWCTIGLRLLAVDPWPRARETRTVSFGVGSSGEVFITAAADSDGSNPWPRRLTSAVVIGEGMQITVNSEVPVWTDLTIRGPVDSFAGSMSTGWSVSIPDGIADGSTFQMVTDPRRKSIRLDGEKAAGLVALGSVTKPFTPGLNVLDVVAPGGDAGTSLSLSWREAFWSLW